MATTFDTYCGLTCEGCEFKESHGCGGCIATKGHPFHAKDEPCEVAACAISKGRRFCGECDNILSCELLKSYSYDDKNGDNGARIENCQRIKLALVSEAREGLDPIACCGFNCDACPYTQWCGGCRSSYNCCSFATLFPDGVCPNLSCSKEKGLDGCYECDELTDCKKGFFVNENKGDFSAKSAAMFIKKYGKEGAGEVLLRMRAADEKDPPKPEELSSAEKIVAHMEKFLM